jgi:hypothetical protein
MIQRLNDNAKDHKAYNDAFDDAAHWLAAMDERVQDCNDTSGDWNTIFVGTFLTTIIIPLIEHLNSFHNYFNIYRCLYLKQK